MMESGRAMSEKALGYRSGLTALSTKGSGSTTRPKARESSPTSMVTSTMVTGNKTRPQATVSISTITALGTRASG